MTTQEDRERALSIVLANIKRESSTVIAMANIIRECVPVPRAELADLRARAVEAEDIINSMLHMADDHGDVLRVDCEDCDAFLARARAFLAKSMQEKETP